MEDKEELDGGETGEGATIMGVWWCGGWWEQIISVLYPSCFIVVEIDTRQFSYARSKTCAIFFYFVVVRMYFDLNWK